LKTYPSAQEIIRRLQSKKHFCPFFSGGGASFYFIRKINTCVNGKVTVPKEGFGKACLSGGVDEKSKIY